ncbi:MAG TPA: hypothetical protein VGO57_13425 [Verrucomicrobiae bacterium]|jgi:hypothetical protein
MKFVFTNSPSKVALRLCLLVLTVAFFAGLTSSSSATQVSWSNAGNINTAPNIDATSFYNYSGTWNILSMPLPFKTQNTLNYYNNGTMNCQLGWDFRFWPSSGSSHWSSSFSNDVHGTVFSTSGLGSLVTQISPVDYLSVAATNLVNRGLLQADVLGQIILVGSNVNLSRSSIDITAVPAGSGANDDNNGVFDPSLAIYDEFWAQGGMTNVNSSAIWQKLGQTGVTNASSTKAFDINVPCTSATSSTALNVTPTFADSTIITNHAFDLTVTLTNKDGFTTTTVVLLTNIVREAVFALVPNTNVSVAVTYRRENDESPTNLYQTVSVQLGASFVDKATLQAQNSFVFLVDTLGSTANRGLYPNNNPNPYAACSGTTFRPRPYTLSRSDVTGSFGSGAPGNNGRPGVDFFYSTISKINGDPWLGFTNPIVAPTYAAYSAEVDNIGIQIPNGSVTNLPGRVNIIANNLDLTQTHIRAEGQVSILASNLVSSAGAVVDCQNLSLNLGATGGLLNVTNISGATVARLNGTVSAWSAIWNNTELAIYTNNYATNAVVTTNNNVVVTNVVAVSVPLTNYVNVGYYVLILDASALATTVPVTVQDFFAHSTNTVVGDNIRVANSLYIDSTSLTLNGNLTLSSPLQDWVYTNAPRLLYFTNNSILTIPNNAHFGDDRAASYLAFVNHGTVNAASESINTVYYQNNGEDEINGAFSLTTMSGRVEGGTINSIGSDVDLNASSLKLNEATIIAGNTLNFNVSGSLFDAGVSSSNALTCNNGFNLLVKPATGDLLGTEVTSVVANQAETDWAAEDRGASVLGFSNNVAIGKLVLLPQGSLFEPLFNFSGTGSSNALYVDYLDLSQLKTAYADMLQINPNLVIYYAAINVGFTPPTLNGVSQTPEEYMNGQFNNHLRWVSNFAGPNSSVDVLINGQTVSVNRALRFSHLIDSNGNGIPNADDTAPFDLAPFVVSGSLANTNQPAANAFGISWTAAPNTVYQIQYATNLVSPAWLPLLNYTNNTTANVPVTLWDTNASAAQRFYRESVIVQFQ